MYGDAPVVLFSALPVDKAYNHVQNLPGYILKDT